MKNKLLKIALSTLLLSATIASAEVATKKNTTASVKNAAISNRYNRYVKLTGGFIKPTETDSVSYKFGGQAHAAFGMSFKAWDVELEVGYYRTNVDKDNNEVIPNLNLTRWTVLTGMINLLYNHSLTDSISAYLGAGAGVASVTYNTDLVSGTSRFGDSTTFAWQLLTGLRYKIDDNWSINGGYRLFNTTKASFADNSIIDIKQPFVHNIEFGFSYRF